MKTKFKTKDPDIIGSMAAAQRAPKRAQRIAKASGAPLVVIDAKKSGIRYRGEARKKKSKR
ncbi:MAG TPA: hypothetical protein VHY37_03550 [Tepidisphaeraceae bacterium]|jgi:hypothetical protein|nr:hypothetical protein [Tepidisphaeraceae bacterium]